MKLEKNDFSGCTYSATLPEFLKFLLLLHLPRVQGGIRGSLNGEKELFFLPQKKIKVLQPGMSKKKCILFTGTEKRAAVKLCCGSSLWPRVANLETLLRHSVFGLWCRKQK